jgi:thiosulfate dehydrogenase
MGRVLLGLLIGIVLVPAAALMYLKYGRPPVAAMDAPFPFEKFVTSIPLKTRIEFEQVTKPPVKSDEDTFVTGAHIYAQECAMCHGYHGQASRFGRKMYPAAPPLWEKSGKDDVVGVSADPLGETYWKVENGIRLTGMPGFKGILTPAQMWQVTMLLANANKPLPPAALAILRGDEPAEAAQSGATALKLPSGSRVEVSGSANWGHDPFALGWVQRVAMLEKLRAALKFALMSMGISTPEKKVPEKKPPVQPASKQ